MKEREERVIFGACRQIRAGEVLTGCGLERCNLPWISQDWEGQCFYQPEVKEPLLTQSVLYKRCVVLNGGPTADPDTGYSILHDIKSSGNVPVRDEPLQAAYLLAFQSPGSTPDWRFPPRIFDSRVS